jgi:glycerol uptake facilitator-like aquaporin
MSSPDRRIPEKSNDGSVCDIENATAGGQQQQQRSRSLWFVSLLRRGCWKPKRTCVQALRDGWDTAVGWATGSRPSLLTKTAAEFTGCAIFHFLGSVAPTPETNAVALMVLVYYTAKLSGAHLNPALTTTFALLGYINPVEVLAYWTAQVLGSAFGALWVGALVPGVWGADPGPGGVGPALSGCFSPTTLYGRTFGWEAVCTFCFILPIFSVVWYTQSKSGYGNTGPIIVGLSLFAAASAAAPWTGASLNPARTLGSVIVFGRRTCPAAVDAAGVYVAAELVGAAVVPLAVAPWYGVSQRVADRMRISAYGDLGAVPSAAPPPTPLAPPTPTARTCDYDYDEPSGGPFAATAAAPEEQQQQQQDQPEQQQEQQEQQEQSQTTRRNSPKTPDLREISASLPLPPPPPAPSPLVGYSTSMARVVRWADESPQQTQQQQQQTQQQQQQTAGVVEALLAQLQMQQMQRPQAVVPETMYSCAPVAMRTTWVPPAPARTTTFRRRGTGALSEGEPA